jgi:hypothetical protein
LKVGLKVVEQFEEGLLLGIYVGMLLKNPSKSFDFVSSDPCQFQTPLNLDSSQSRLLSVQPPNHETPVNTFVKLSTKSSPNPSTKIPFYLTFQAVGVQLMEVKISSISMSSKQNQPHFPSSLKFKLPRAISASIN